MSFLVADMQLYTRLYPSVHLSVRLLVMIELKSGKTSVLDIFEYDGRNNIPNYTQTEKYGRGPCVTLCYITRPDTRLLYRQDHFKS